MGKECRLPQEMVKIPAVRSACRRRNEDDRKRAVGPPAQ